MAIVVYVSGATDSRPVEALLTRHGLSFTLEPMPMGSAEQREKFGEMKQRHGWSSLPMVFIDDAFIGGEPELRAHLAGRARDPAAPLAYALGLGGLLPFVALAVVMIAGIDVAPLQATKLLAAYAATILSFVGAVHWGIAIGAGQSGQRLRLLAGSVVPALIAWLALALPAASGLWVFIGGFVGWYIWERATAWTLYPAFYQKLRSLLTAIVSTTLLLVALLS